MTEFLDKFLLGIFLGTSFGPVSIAIINYGLKAGPKKSLEIIIGAALADIIQLLLVFFGLSFLINISVIKLLLFVFGAIILIYFGYQNIVVFVKNKDLLKGNKVKNGNVISAGFLLNISNPMALIWWSGIFGATLAAMSVSTKTMGLLYGLTIIFGIVVWNTILTAMTNWGKRFIREKYFRFISLFSGIMLIVYGLKLFLSYKW